MAPWVERPCQEAAPPGPDAGGSPLCVLALRPRSCWGLAARASGWHGWRGRPGRAGGAGVCPGAPHPSLPAELVGAAKSWWNRAQVPMCLVTRLLFEKSEWCPEHPTSAFISGAWSRAGVGPVPGCLCRAVSAEAPGMGDYGREYYPAQRWVCVRWGQAKSQSGQKARPPPAADTRCLLCAGLVCQVQGLPESRALSPGAQCLGL